MRNSIRRRPGLVFALTVMLTAIFMQPPTLYALPERSELTYYYSGCGTSKTLLGIYGVECNGHHPNSYNGSTPWKWRVHLEEICDNGNCSEWCTPDSWWEEKCQNGTSKFVTESEFNAGICTC
ncbi:MAG TPA: hypothetical protein VEK11_01870 [Thermoanaerobaculia bacterium]|jgi:hypothetical protein|nr:hypothetical protein [Thermoanaerobaculia bacterium]